MREAAQKFPTLTETITDKLLEIFPQIKSAKVMRFTLWILREFVNNREDVQNVMTQVRACLGELPLTESELKKAAGVENEDEGSSSSSDGNKAAGDKTQSARLVTMLSPVSLLKPLLLMTWTESNYAFKSSLRTTVRIS
jgi:coatomer subunit beta